MQIRPYQPADEQSVLELWSQCGLIVPQNNPRADIARKLAVAPELFVVGVLNQKIVATAMAGYEGHRGWINYLAVSPHVQRLGYGRQIVVHVESLLRARDCPKINLQVRSTNTGVIEFYERLGFVKDAVISLGKRLVIDEPYEPASEDQT